MSTAILFVAVVAATVVVSSVGSFQAELVTTPEGNSIYHPAGTETDDDTSSIVKVEVKNITSNSVEFFILVSGSAKFIEVEYKNIWSDTPHYRMQWDYGDNYEVKDLDTSYKYSFRFRSVPSKNESWSDEYITELLPDKPEIVLEKVAEGTVTFWYTPVHTVDIDFYELKYFKVYRDMNGWSPDGTCVTTIQIPSCKDPPYKIYGMSPNSYYELQLRAHAAAGYGDSFKQRIFLREYV